MTSKVLTDAMIHNGKHNIRQSLKVTLIILALHLLGAPALIISMMYRISRGISMSVDDFILVISIGATFLAGCGGILIALSNFRYLYNKSQVDMCLAQPMSRKQRFVSDYLSGLISYIAPFIAVQVLSSVMLLIAHLAMDGKEYQFGVYNDTLLPKKEICTVFGEAAPYYFKIVLVGILTMIMLYTLTVLIAVCCGALFESVAYTIFANAALPLSILLLFEGFFPKLLGVELQHIIIPLITWTSPAGCCTAVVYSIAGAASKYSGYYNGFPLWQWAIGYVISVSAMIAGAYFLYMKRRAEQVSKPFVFRGLYYIVVTFILFCITALFVNNYIDEMVPMIITTFVIYMLLDIISRRGFKRLWAGVLRYIATMVCLLGFAGIIDATGCFGIEKAVPDASQVSKVYISYNGVHAQYSSISSGFEYFSGKKEEQEALGVIELKTPENIAAVVEAHKAITGNISKGHGYIRNTLNQRISICYVMKSGKRMVRDYFTMPEEAVTALLSVETSQEYREQYISYVSRLCANSYDVQKEYMWVTDSEHPNLPRISIEPIRKYEYDHAYGNNGKFYPDREFFDRLGAALENDLRGLSPENYLRPSSPKGYSITIYSSLSGNARYNYCSVLVTMDMKETVALLYSCGYLSAYDIDGILDIYMNNVATKNTIKIYSYSDYQEAMKCDTVCTAFSSRDSGNSCGKYVVDYSPELVELFKVMYSTYITDEPCYTIRVDGRLYAVPMEYSRAAEKVYASAVKLSDDDVQLYYNGYYYDEDTVMYDYAGIEKY